VSIRFQFFYVGLKSGKGYPMPKSKKPRVKRPGANPVKKPAWQQALSDTAGQHGEKPIKTGKKAQNKSA
jgi:hypothetical protein